MARRRCEQSCRAAGCQSDIISPIGRCFQCSFLNDSPSSIDCVSSLSLWMAIQRRRVGLGLVTSHRCILTARDALRTISEGLTALKFLVYSVWNPKPLIKVCLSFLSSGRFHSSAGSSLLSGVLLEGYTGSSSTQNSGWNCLSLSSPMSPQQLLFSVINIVITSRVLLNTVTTAKVLLKNYCCIMLDEFAYLQRSNSQEYIYFLF